MTSNRALHISCFLLLTSFLIASAPVACSNPNTPPPPCENNDCTKPPPVGSAVLVGAGDIAGCDTPGNSPGAFATAKLLDVIAGAVFTAGDNAYSHGSDADYRDCFDPLWGRHKARIHPAVGNHEYDTPNATGYFNYFGAAAGPIGQGYYAFDVGAWRIIMLNSEIDASATSVQMQWLKSELTDNPHHCTAAVWHRPLFNSGVHQEAPQMKDVWRTLYQFNADLVINGHEHAYERFAPQDPDGHADSARGIRQVTVGTGGAPLYSQLSVKPNSEVRINSSWGVLKLTLSSTGYQWDFVPTDLGGLTDTGTGVCH